jgi:beta-1,4-mannosyl-glycoprotein beta-1,4-N-acetylglucosaminyltransferase
VYLTLALGGILKYKIDSYYIMKIIDCFIFYNELDLLTYRLNLLNDIVDYFVIVEATHTFIGKEKPLFFNENKHLFEKFSNKIIHIIVNDFPYKYSNVNIPNDCVWQNEYFQRNAISRGINYIKDLSQADLIIISDCDEIPDPHTLDKIKKGDIIVDINILEMDFYYYNLHTRHRSKWPLCKIISYEKYNKLNKTCNDIRNIECSRILNGGWHLSYFGDKNFIQNKIKNFSHQEYNNDRYTDLEKIENRVKASSDAFDRHNTILDKIRIEDNKYLPIDYNKFLNKYYN